MRENPTPEPGDWDQAPFSNGTEGYDWLHNVCGAGDGCIHDSIHGQASENDLDTETHCPLITLSLMQVWPREWERVEVPFTSVDGAEMTYHRPGACSEYTDHISAAAPDAVIAVDLFGEYRTEPEGAQ